MPQKQPHPVEAEKVHSRIGCHSKGMFIWVSYNKENKENSPSNDYYIPEVTSSPTASPSQEEKKQKLDSPGLSSSQSSYTTSDSAITSIIIAVGLVFDDLVEIELSRSLFLPSDLAYFIKLTDVLQGC